MLDDRHALQIEPTRRYHCSATVSRLRNERIDIMCQPRQNTLRTCKRPQLQPRHTSLSEASMSVVHLLQRSKGDGPVGPSADTTDTTLLPSQSASSVPRISLNMYAFLGILALVALFLIMLCTGVALISGCRADRLLGRQLCGRRRGWSKWMEKENAQKQETTTTHKETCDVDSFEAKKVDL